VKIERNEGIYQILGRASSDIIKSGGFKISALDIERYFKIINVEVFKKWKATFRTPSNW
jgi:acyl-CoA synthetase (AMP-forming)/AMP-acid ligase II